MMVPFCLSDQFSPRVRGCSGSVAGVTEVSHVFPACAGMFRGMVAAVCSTTSFPRVCGDVPGGYKGYYTIETFSPRVRGCSLRVSG